MSTDAATLVISVAVAVRQAHNAGLVPDWLARGFLRHGGRNQTLLLLSEHSREHADNARRWRDGSRARECERIAKAVDGLAANVHAAGDWPVLVCGATSQALNAFDAVLKTLREAHGLEKLIVADTADQDLGFERTTSGSQRPVINEWRATVFASRGAHSQYVVSGRIYGDPRLNPGSSVTIRATVSPDEGRAEGVDRDYELGRPARTSQQGPRDDG